MFSPAGMMKNMSEHNQQHEEFFKLFMANQNKIYTFILMQVPSSSDADDILQETASLMWSKFSEYRPGSDFASWGVTIARFRILNHRRKHFNSPVRYSSQTLEAVSEHAALMLQVSDGHLDSLRHCLDKLDERDRRFIDMRYAGAMTIKAIAGKVGRSANGLYKSMARIHKNLMDCVKQKESMEGTA